MPGVSALAHASATALVTALWTIVLSGADFTYQTSPSSGQIANTAEGLSVQWEIRPGNSPDSNSPAPDLVAVSLGYKDASGNPKVLFPPISGLGSTVPFGSGQFTWQKIEFSVFTGNKEDLPPLGVNSQFFIYISDQGTGYRSNGQVFAIVDTASMALPGPVPQPTSTPTNSLSSSPVVSSSSELLEVSPSAQHMSSPTTPVSVAPIGDRDSAQSTKARGEANATTPPVTSTKAVLVSGKRKTQPAISKTTSTLRPTGSSGRGRRKPPSRTSSTKTSQAAKTVRRLKTGPPVIASTSAEDHGRSRSRPISYSPTPAATSTVSSTVQLTEQLSPMPGSFPTPKPTARATTAISAVSTHITPQVKTSPTMSAIPAGVSGNATPVEVSLTADIFASTTDSTVADPNAELSSVGDVVASDLQGSGSPAAAAASPSIYSFVAVLTFAAAWW